MLKDYLKLKRIHLNLRQDEMAKQIGITTQTYNYLENGKIPSMKTVKKLAAYFNLTESEIRDL